MHFLLYRILLPVEGLSRQVEAGVHDFCMVDQMPPGIFPI